MKDALRTIDNNMASEKYDKSLQNNAGNGVGGRGNRTQNNNPLAPGDTQQKPKLARTREDMNRVLREDYNWPVNRYNFREVTQAEWDLPQDQQIRHACKNKGH